MLCRMPLSLLLFSCLRHAWPAVSGMGQCGVVLNLAQQDSGRQASSLTTASLALSIVPAHVVDGYQGRVQPSVIHVAIRVSGAAG